MKGLLGHLFFGIRVGIIYNFIVQVFLRDPDSNIVELLNGKELEVISWDAAKAADHAGPFEGR